MHEWISPLVALSIGICLAWLIQKRRVSAVRQALDREARVARERAARTAAELRQELDEARAGEKEAQQKLDQLEDRLSEQGGHMTRLEGEVRQTEEEAARLTKALKGKTEEVQQLRQQAAVSREDLASAQTGARQAEEALEQLSGRIGALEAAAQIAAAAEDELRQKLAEERRRRRDSIRRASELEAEIQRLKEERPTAGAASQGAEATTAPKPRPSPEPAAPQIRRETKVDAKVETVAPRAADPLDAPLDPVPELEETDDKPASAPPAAGGPTVLDVLDTDNNLNAGQRETIRIAYSGFAPKVTPCGATSASPDLTVMEVLEEDPNLNWGQRETIRAIYAQFVRAPRAQPSPS